MSQYIPLLFIFVVNNRDQFLINSEIHRFNLHLPSANLDIYQNAVHYSGITIFKSLPLKFKKVSDNLRVFKIALKHLIHELLLFIR